MDLAVLCLCVGEEEDTGGTRMGDRATITVTTTTVAGVPIAASTNSNNASDSSTSSSNHKSEVFHKVMATIGLWGEVGHRRDAFLLTP